MQRIFGRGFVLAAIAGVSLHAQGVEPGSPEFFETKVRPVLATSCFGCHTETAMGGLRLDSAEAMAKGGKRGPSVTPGAPDKSLLISAIKHADPALKMPMGNKLKANEIADIEAWVKAGAVWPKAVVSSNAKGADGKYVIRPEARTFWSLAPLKAPSVPA